MEFLRSLLRWELHHPKIIMMRASFVTTPAFRNEALALSPGGERDLHQPLRT